MDERVEELERKVSELSSRLERLEGRADGQARAVAGSRVDPSTVPPNVDALVGLLPDLGAFVPSVSLFGRTLVIIGGAFLIRAVTDKGLVDPGVGVGLGIAFATAWVIVAWREAGLDRALSATFLGITACFIGFPLILESATRLALVSTSAAAIILAFFATALLAGAAHRGLRLVAWVGVLGGTATAALLLRGTSTSPFGPSAALVALFVLSSVLAEMRGWNGPRWVTALIADGAVTREVFSASAHPETVAQVGPALVLSTVMVLATFAFVARRTLASLSLKEAPVAGLPLKATFIGAFEVVQVALAITVGLVTTARAAPFIPWVPVVAGALSLLIAFGALVTSVKLSERAEAGFEVWFHGAAGLALLLGGGPLLATGPVLAFTWAALGLVAAVLARHSHTAPLWSVGVVLAWAASFTGGVFGLLFDGLWGATDVLWAPFSLENGLVLGLVAVAYLSMAVRPPAATTATRALPGTLLALAVLASVAAVAYLARGLGASDPAWVALLRTLVMVLVAVGLGALRRLGGPSELAWVGWGTLGAAGFKMLGQDLQAGRPSTLFIAFLALGSGILALPRLLRVGSPPPGR